MSRKRKGVPVHGWLVVDKPVGITSAAVVGKVKRLTDAAKVGHAGTLDPLASGILPIALGEATKTVAWAMDGSKTYRFTIRFGETRTTDDAEGEVTATSPIRPDDAAIRAALPRFVGTIRQRPPAFSALKVAGQRAYDLARAGEEVVLEEREITIDRLDLLARPDADHADFEVACGKGTYVRSLARDIAAALGTVGYVAALRRTQVGRFTEAQAFLLDSDPENRHGAAALERLLPITTALDDIPALALTEAQADDLRHGRSVSLAGSGFPGLETPSSISAEPVVLATCGGNPVALCRLTEGPSVWGLSPWRVFNL